MSTTFLAFLILGCSIFVFFSQEFGNFFKKIFAIWGMKTVLPLTVASFLLVFFEPWIIWIVFGIQSSFISMIYAFASVLPFPKIAIYLSMFLFLISLSFLPGLVIDLWIKRKHYPGFIYRDLLTLVLWLIVTLLLITGVFSIYR